MDKIYILLPVFNRKNITEKIVKCLCKQSFQNYHLVLIDDGSTDGTAEMVQSYIKAENLTVIRGTGDWWCFGSFQQGINWLKEKSPQLQDIILLINDDDKVVQYSKQLMCEETGISYSHPVNHYFYIMNFITVNLHPWF